MVDYAPYAQALFELASSHEQEKEWMSQLDEAAQVLVSLPELQKVLAHPSVSRNKKKEILKTAFEKDLDVTVYRFLLVLNEHDVIAHLKEISCAYEECYRKAHHIEVIHVKSASKLDASMLSKLKDMLEKKLNKTLELDVQVDPSLIAGIRVQSSDFVMDNTVVARIEAMKEALNR